MNNYTIICMIVLCFAGGAGLVYWLRYRRQRRLAASHRDTRDQAAAPSIPQPQVLAFEVETELDVEPDEPLFCIPELAVRDQQFSDCQLCEFIEERLAEQAAHEGALEDWAQSLCDMLDELLMLRPQMGQGDAAVLDGIMDYYREFLLTHHVELLEGLTWDSRVQRAACARD